MRSLSAVACVSSLLALHLHYQVQGCGVIVHTELIRRALYAYNNSIFGPNALTNVLENNPGAIQAGAPFPDTMYSPLCGGGRFHEVAEDVHWGRYQIEAWDYFQRTYPNPIGDPKAETLMAFLLGVASHSVTDVSWHNLRGLKDGLIRMLADTSFNGVYNEAHPFADVGGDIIGTVAWNASFHTKWVVPSDDLYNIFRNYYNGKDVMTKGEMNNCIAEMQALRALEREAGFILYPIITQASSIFQDQLEDYFEGGMEDMTAWTRLVWDQVLYIGKHGSKSCRSLPQESHSNPMDIRCTPEALAADDDNKNGDSNVNRNVSSNNSKNNSKRSSSVVSSSEEALSKRRKWNFMLKMFGMKPKDLMRYVTYDEQSGSLTEFRVDTDRLNKDMKGKNERIRKLVESLAPSADKTGSKAEVTKAKATKAKGRFSVDESFARLGQSLLVADLDGNGIDDVVVGAPGSYVTAGSRHSNGCVYVLRDGRIRPRGPEIRICSPPSDIYGNFGHSLTFANGTLYVGSPTIGTENLSYMGRVYGYDVTGIINNINDDVINPSQILAGDSGSLTSTYGWTLAGTMSGDLVVGSKFQSIFNAYGGDEVHQSGSVKVSDEDNFDAGDGSQDYGWTGSAILPFTTAQGNEYIAVATHNHAVVSSSCDNGGECASHAVKGAGKVEIRAAHPPHGLVSTLVGSGSFQGFGSSLAAGQLSYAAAAGKKTVLAVGSATFSNGHVFSGAVDLFDTDLLDKSPAEFAHQSPLTRIQGAFANGHFGKSLAITESGELVVGAPNEGHVSNGQLGAGKVYVFSQLEEGDMSSNCRRPHDAPCPEEKAGRVLLPIDDVISGGGYVTDIGQQFGARVASTSNNDIIVSAHRKSHGQNQQSGAIYIF